jgi:hypothetical protein
MSAPPYLCPLCGRPAKKDSIPVGLSIQCEQCGSYEFTGSAEAVFPGYDHRLRRKIGFWTRDQNDLGESPRITSYTADTISKIPEKTVAERADRLLRFALREQRDLGGRFRLNTALVVGVTHSQSDGDVQALARLLHNKGWLNSGYDSGLGQITPEGFMYASERPVAESVNGFIAMWFDKSMDAARTDGLEPAIRGAGYTPIVVSGVEHINKIDDEIISQIRRAKFVVADCTGQRGGVYFEAGFAMGLGLPVFWTCRQDDLVNLHFDIRQYNSIDWVDAADLANRLRRRIEAVIGPGPISIRN